MSIFRDQESEDESVATVGDLLDAERIRREISIARAEEALRRFELLTLDAGYEPMRPGLWIDNVVSRLRRLMIACEHQGA
jgi:hypothetical protein